ncbi:hypothetical protein RSOLAG22IIIB_04754 [Rhizoctonia solani]|uniref:Uncharacterized protein n=1 Tax=Rhizoctonia solani TaxID=456999 RepID=A0A0K6G0C6_9AGAM|nr:hypothetical protein RSOLAG22IIIB_04754 [Rhizoctonia solani]
MKRNTPNSPNKNTKASKMRNQTGGASTSVAQATVATPASTEKPKGRAVRQLQTPDVSITNPNDPDEVEIPETDNDCIITKNQPPHGRSGETAAKDSGKDGSDDTAPAKKKSTRGRPRKNVVNDSDKDASDDAVAKDKPTGGRSDKDASDDADAAPAKKKPTRGRPRKDNAKVDDTATAKAKPKRGRSGKGSDDDGDDVSLETEPKPVVLKTAAFKDAETLSKSYLNHLCHFMKIKTITYRSKENAYNAKSSFYIHYSQFLKDLASYEDSLPELARVQFRQVQIEEAVSRRTDRLRQLCELQKEIDELRYKVKIFESSTTGLQKDLADAQAQA